MVLFRSLQQKSFSLLFHMLSSVPNFEELYCLNMNYQHISKKHHLLSIMKYHHVPECSIFDPDTKFGLYCIYLPYTLVSLVIQYSNINSKINPVFQNHLKSMQTGGIKFTKNHNWLNIYGFS